MGSAAAAVATAPLLGSAPAVSSNRRPNVILIVLDDLGSLDANCFGSHDLITPSLDALAGEGVRFTQFYAAAPLCSPSRAAVLTGRYPQRAGVPSNVSSIPGGAGMPVEEVTLAQVLKSAGYATGHVGKWHLGYLPEIMPNAKGFDESFGNMGGCIDNYSHFFFWQGPNRHDLWQNGEEVWRDGQNIGDLMVERCKAFISANKDKPFFLYWAINQPHYPLQGREKWRMRYRNLAPPRSMYAAFVSTLDESIGRVLATLRQLRLTEQTIVALQSDHGHSTEDRAFGGGGNPGPYRGCKFSLFEGGIRVVSMLSWPGTLPRGAVRGQLVTGCDWMPTICELTGVPLPKRRIDGKSMVPIVHSPTAATEHETFFWAFEQQWAVREGNWKLIANPRDPTNKAPLTPADKLFLVDLSKDVSELTNRAKDHPDVVQRMSALHQKWWADVAR